MTPAMSSFQARNNIYATIEGKTSSIDVKLSFLDSDYDFECCSSTGKGQSWSIYDSIKPLLSGEANVHDQIELMAYLATTLVRGKVENFAQSDLVTEELEISKKHLLTFTNACQRPSAAACVQLRNELDACSCQDKCLIDPRLRLDYYIHDEEVLTVGKKSFSVLIALLGRSESARSATKKYIWARIAASGKLHLYNRANNRIYAADEVGKLALIQPFRYLDTIDEILAFVALTILHRGGTLPLKKLPTFIKADLAETYKRIQQAAGALSPVQSSKPVNIDGSQSLETNKASTVAEDDQGRSDKFEQWEARMTQVLGGMTLLEDKIAKVSSQAELIALRLSSAAAE
jgi:hypothetical protein